MSNKYKKYTRHSYKLVKSSPYFDAKWYVKKYPDVAASGLDAAAHYLLYGWRRGLLPGPFFDGNLYLETYPKILEADFNPLLHYEQHGRKERRSIGYLPKNLRLINRSPYFNRKWYCRQYPDVDEYGLDPVVHYLMYGWKKGYNPSPQFDTQFYLDNNRDVRAANICPLVHYISHGRAEGRMLMGDAEGIHGTRKNAFLSYLSRKFYQFLNRDLIRANSGSRIAVHVHLFYTQLWYEIKDYLKNLECYKYDLYITHSRELEPEIEENIREFKNDAIFFLTPNKGFDLGAHIYFLHQIELDDYDVIFKLHTKRDVGGKNYYGLYMKGGEWRKMLYDGILSANNVHKVIDYLSSPESQVGLVANDKLIVTKDMMYCKEKVVQAMVRYDLDMPQDYKYVAGTMYAIKPRLLQPIKNVVNIDSFEESRRGVFTLAHCFERIICLQVEAQGYVMKGLRTMYWNTWLRYIQSKRHPHKDIPLLNPEMVNKCTFYQNRVPYGLVEVSSLLKEKNEALFNALLQKGEMQEGVTEPIDSDSMEHAQLLQNLVNNRVVARLSSAIDITIFKLVGERITVEKKARKRFKHRIRVCNQQPQFLLVGTYLNSRIQEILTRENYMPDLESLLVPYVEAVFHSFRTRNALKLAPCAWDAIPRNTIIDYQERYKFFDLNIELLLGVDKSYFLFRVVRDVYMTAVKMQLPLSLNDFKELYGNLCNYFQLKGDFELMKKKEAQNLPRLRIRLPLFSELKENLIYWFCVIFKFNYKR